MGLLQFRACKSLGKRWVYSPLLHVDARLKLKVQFSGISLAVICRLQSIGSTALSRGTAAASAINAVVKVDDGGTHLFWIGLLNVPRRS